jgi:hypothetical protein
VINLCDGFVYISVNDSQSCSTKTTHIQSSQILTSLDQVISKLNDLARDSEIGTSACKLDVNDSFMPPRAFVAVMQDGNTLGCVALCFWCYANPQTFKRTISCLDILRLWCSMRLYMCCCVCITFGLVSTVDLGYEQLRIVCEDKRLGRPLAATSTFGSVTYQQTSFSPWHVYILICDICSYIALVHDPVLVNNKHYVLLQLFMNAIQLKYRLTIQDAV